MAMFNSKLLVYQRVNNTHGLVIPSPVYIQHPPEETIVDVGNFHIIGTIEMRYLILGWWD